MCAQIILLHGASSSGKTTLARAVQARIELAFWHVSIDHLRESGVLPMDHFRSGDFDWVQHRKQVFDGFHASLSAYADAGNNLIVEHILDEDGWVETLKHALQSHDVFFVGLHCDLSTLQDREVRRGDRPLGSAAQDFGSIHKGRQYDLELDGTTSPQENVRVLLDAWRGGRRVSEFSSTVSTA